MDCHDVHALLAFMRRDGDQIDATELAAVQQHLEACSDCAAASHSEQLVDAALGSAMRTVPVPADLRGRVLAKLSVNRPRPPWGKIAAAAAVAIALGLGTTAWVLYPQPQVVGRGEILVRDIDADSVEEWYRNRGIDMASWRQLDHSLLWTYDVVEFQGRRVPKLIFYYPPDEKGRSAVAQVIVLRRDRFDTTDLRGISGDRPTLIVERDNNPDYVYVVATTAENLDFFLIDGAR